MLPPPTRALRIAHSACTQSPPVAVLLSAWVLILLLPKHAGRCFTRILLGVQFNFSYSKTVTFFSINVTIVTMGDRICNSLKHGDGCSFLCSSDYAAVCNTVCSTHSVTNGTVWSGSLNWKRPCKYCRIDYLKRPAVTHNLSLQHINLSVLGSINFM
jgi:hypothetical protein